MATLNCRKDEIHFYDFQALNYLHERRQFFTIRGLNSKHRTGAHTKLQGNPHIAPFSSNLRISAPLYSATLHLFFFPLCVILTYLISFLTADNYLYTQSYFLPTSLGQTPNKHLPHVKHKLQRYNFNTFLGVKMTFDMYS